MFHFGLLLVFVSLPCGYFSAKLNKLPPAGDLRLGDLEFLCDWFCSDDSDYEDSEELIDEAGRGNPRIFCELCDDPSPTKRPTTPRVSSTTDDTDSDDPEVITLPSIPSFTLPETSEEPPESTEIPASTTLSTTISPANTTLMPPTTTTTTTTTIQP